MFEFPLVYILIEFLDLLRYTNETKHSFAFELENFEWIRTEPRHSVSRTEIPILELNVSLDNENDI